MKKFLLNFVIIGLISCSNEAPTPQKLALNIQTIEPNTVISVIANDDYPVPVGSQIIEQTGEFNTLDNVYNKSGDRILIPRNAIIRGTYRNDGVSCLVSWNAIYANKHEAKKSRGSFSLSRVTGPSVCDPMKGIKAGGRVTIGFHS